MEIGRFIPAIACCGRVESRVLPVIRLSCRQAWHLIFRTGPEQGIIRISWDGKDQIVDLYTPDEGIRQENLEPGFNWRQADANRKILVLSAFMAEFIILTVLILLGYPVAL